MEGRISRRTPWLRRCPQKFVVAVAIAEFGGMDAGRIFEQHTGIVLAPVPCRTGSLQVVLGKCRSIGTVTARRDCHHRSQVGGSASAFIRSETCANHIVGAKLV